MSKNHSALYKEARILRSPWCGRSRTFLRLHFRIGHPTQTEKVAAFSNLTDNNDELEREEKEEEAQANEEVVSGGVHDPSTPSTPPVYRPREALHNALRDWLTLMLQVGRSLNLTLHLIYILLRNKWPQFRRYQHLTEKTSKLVHF